jgi:4-diphosphocytidyl-2-C-methyl-D-erythritol kinase
VDEADEDVLAVDGADLDLEDNLVTRSIAAMRSRGRVPPLDIRLQKRIPLGAGLGGGSSNAAATLTAAAEISKLPHSLAEEVGPSLGSDVAIFFKGGSLLVTGVGEALEPLPPLSGFSVAVAVPVFEMSTPEVYRRWDELEGPTGEEISPRLLPPALREGIPIRNDLTPAAFALEPELADFVADLRGLWGRPVAMTGSGSACFAFFADLDEAEGGADSIASRCREAVGAGLRPIGVARSV